MSEKKKKDLELESNNLTILVILSLCLICSMGYITFEKYFTKYYSTSVEEKEKTSAKKIVYNKDGLFIKSLINKVVLHTGIDHSEYQLYAKDKVTLADLSETYKNTLVVNTIGKTSFSTEDLNDASIEVFGQNIYSTIQGTIDVICGSYGITNGETYIKAQTGGCGGTGYRYYDKIESIDSDENHIYVYQRVGFSCTGGICKNIQKTSNGYEGVEVIKTLNSPFDPVDLDNIKNDLNLYKFTFTYDSNNNIYYFESVEKEK